MNDERLSHLVSRHLDGQLDSGEQLELEDCLRSSAAARAQFWNETRLHGLLREVESEAVDKKIETLPPTWRRPPVVIWSSAIAACLTLLGIIGFFLRADKPGLPVAPLVKSEATTSAIAILTRVADVRWEDAAAAPHPGAALEPGWLRFKSGLAQIEFFGGARVLIEGPAEIQLISRAEAFCRAGKLSAEVPAQARGFRIGTPHGNIVDLGTEFGLAVNDSSAAVHVFKGEVELHALPSGQLNVKEGEAMQVEGAATPRETPFDRGGFASIRDLDRQSVESLRRHEAEWLLSSARINADPSLLTRFDFSKAGPFDRTLRNLAEHGSMVHDASIVGCRWTEGRWPGKNALEFGRVSDRVRLDVPGEFQSLTFAAWVRVNGLDRSYNSLFMADGFEPGELHWQILNNGVVRLGVARPAAAGSHADYDSPLVFTPERFGQWIHLAMVYDGAGRTVTHYVNGAAVSRSDLAFEIPLRIGPSQLGNWDTDSYAISGPIAIRHFSGCMDEFELFTRGLSEDEVRGLYAVGMPQAGLILARTASTLTPNHAH